MASRTGALADGERLPLPAAADMLALALVAESHVRRPLQLELDSFVQRVHASADEAGSARFSQVVLAALAQIGPAGGLTLEAAQSAADLVTLACLHDPASIASIAGLICTGSDQFSSATVANLIAVLGDDQALGVAQRALQGWLAGERVPWRENDAATGRDMLLGHVAVALTCAGHHKDAIAIACRWPPTRSMLAQLVTQLCQAGQHEGIVAIAKQFDPDGLLYRAVVQAITAADRTALDDNQRTAMAEALWTLAPEMKHAGVFAAEMSEQAWEQRRESLAADALARGDNEDVIDALGDGPQVVDALLAMIERNPGRARFVKAAVDKLDTLDLDAGLQARCLWLNKACQAWPSLASASRARKAVSDLRAVACRLGEPALAEHYIEALRTACNEPALLNILR